MTASPSRDGAFQEVFLLGVTRKGTGQEYQFAGITEFDSLDFKEGDKDGEGVALGNGGRVWKRTPEGDVEFTAKIYPLSLNVTHATDMAQFFLGGTYSTSTPVVQYNSRGRELFGVAILFTSGTATAASGTVAAYCDSRRIIVRDCRVTSYKEDFGDGILSAEVTFKAPAFDLSGNGNVIRQSARVAEATGFGATVYT